MADLAPFNSAFVLLVGAAYAFGYLVWSVHAWQNDLGLLPALRAQYLLAGLVPLLMLPVVYLLLRGVFVLLDRLPPKARKVVQVVVSAAVFALLIAIELQMEFYLIDRSFEVTESPAVHITLSILSIAGTVAVFLGLSAVIFSAKVLANRQRLEKGFLSLLIVGLAVTAVYAYVALVYPAIPQALGGVQPRCLKLDVATQHVSAATLAALEVNATRSDGEDAGGASARPEVMPTEAVDVLFMGSDFVLVRPQATRLTVEIQRDAIRAARSC